MDEVESYCGKLLTKRGKLQWMQSQPIATHASSGIRMQQKWTKFSKNG
jgi:hypothetical protein